MKFAAEVDLGEIFQKPKWFCFLTFTCSSEVSEGGGGGGVPLISGPADHGKSCFTRGV